MKSLIRKNGILPSYLEPIDFQAIFWHIRDFPEAPQSKRVEVVLELLSSLGDDQSKIEKMQVLARLRDVLHGYHWANQISPTSEGLWVSYFPAKRDKLSPEDLWEYGAIRNLLDIVPYLGRRPRIRRCVECQEWFFAAQREDQDYCGGACRQHHYDSDPKVRARKIKKMRENRVTEKKIAERNKKLSGFRAKKSLR